jgi:AbrB family looped-hinge helix DNA binding protein
MDPGMVDTMVATMDAAGQIVLPKTVRERAQLSPGVPIEVRVVDDRVELEPASAKVTIEHRSGLSRIRFSMTTGTRRV